LQNGLNRAPPNHLGPAFVYQNRLVIGHRPAVCPFEVHHFVWPLGSLPIIMSVSPKRAWVPPPLRI
jgi:hypothetical protein